MKQSKSRGFRPEKIADIIHHANHRVEVGFDFATAFSMAWREFLDAFYGMEDAERAASLQAEPAPVSPVRDAKLAATAEQLALNFKLPVPGWVNQPGRFLKHPVFASGDLMKGILLRESPTAFRRRGLFYTGNVLTRASMLQAKPNHGKPVPLPPLAEFIAQSKASARHADAKSFE